MEGPMLVVSPFNPPFKKALFRGKTASVCRQLDKIVLVSDDGQACVFSICLSEPSPIWSTPAKVQSALYSEDSDELVTLSSSGDIQIWRYQGCHITEMVCKQYTQLTAFLQPWTSKGDESVAVKVLAVLAFTKNKLLLFADSERLVSFTWSVIEPWTRHFAVKTLPCVAVSLIKDAVFLLSDNGLLVVYCLKSGRQTLSMSLASTLPQPCILRKISVCGGRIAVADHNHQLFLLDLEDLKGLGGRLQFSSSADKYWPTNPGQFRGAESYPTRTRGQAWGKDFTKKKEDQPSLDFALVTALHGVQVSSLHLSESCLSVCYTSTNEGEGQGGLYRGYHPLTGACTLEYTLEPHTLGLPAAYLGLDAFLSPSGLQIYLGSTSRKQLAIMAVQKVGVVWLGRLLQGPVWEHIDVAIPVLKEGIGVQHLDIMRLALKLHAAGFKRAVCLSGEEWSREIPNSEYICANLEELFKLLVCGIEESLATPPLAQNLVVLALNHSYDLLGTLCEGQGCAGSVVPPHAAGDWLEPVEQKLMKVVITLRAYLYHAPHKSNSTRPPPPSATTLGGELEGLSSALQLKWQAWHALSEQELVCEAVREDCVALAQRFMVRCRGKSPSQASHEIEQIVGDWILGLLREKKLEECYHIWANMKREPHEQLKKLFLTTTEDEVRDLCLGLLQEEGNISEEELRAATFLRNLIHALRIALHKNRCTPQLQLNVSNVTEQSQQWEQMVWAELGLHWPDPRLEELVQPHAVWKYLLLINRADLLVTWINFCFAHPNENNEISLATSPYLERVFSFFCSSSINQEMVEDVNNIDCLKCTKQTVLDQLSRYNVWCSQEQSSLSAVASRLARTYHLRDCETHTASPSGLLLLRSCVAHRLANVLFSSLADKALELEPLMEQMPLPQAGLQWLRAGLALAHLTPNHPSSLLSAAQLSLPLCPPATSAPDYVGLAITLLAAEESPGDIAQQLAQKGPPLLESVLTPESWHNSRQMDISLYELLEKASMFDVTRLFGWQESHRKKCEDAIAKLPHFSKGSEFENFAHHEDISMEYYLRHSRPSYAFCAFAIALFKSHRRLSKRSRRQACNLAHGLALTHLSSHTVSAACVSFVEMLGQSSDKLRLHLTAARLALRHSSAEEVGVVLERLLHCRERAAPQLLALLEKALLPLVEQVPVSSISTITSLEYLKQWGIAVKLALTHNLPLPLSLLHYYAEHDCWLHLLLCLEIYQYPTEQALAVFSKLSSSEIREHLTFALLRTAGHSPKPPPQPLTRLKQRDTRKLLYSKIGVSGVSTEERTMNDSTSDASSLGESMERASSRPTMQLCKELACSDELFPQMLKCHASLEAGQEMLSASLEHNSPLLAVLASCYQCVPLACLGIWLLTSLSEDARAKVETQLKGKLGRHALGPKETRELWVLVLATGHSSTLSAGLNIFLPDNPLCALVQFIKICSVDKNFEESSESLAAFKTKYQTLPVAVVSTEEGCFLGERHWVSCTAVQLVCTALSKNFSSSYHQHLFLELLTSGSFCKHLPVEAPDFSYLLQVHANVLGTRVQLDLSLLCEPEADSQQELTKCLAQLVELRHFTEALQLAHTVGLSTDDVLVAQWSHLATVESLKSNFWGRCQNAFEAADIQPLVAAEFFHTHSETRPTVGERYEVLRLAHEWFFRATQLSPRRETQSHRAAEVEQQMWRARLSLQGEKQFLQDQDKAPKMFTQLLKDVVGEENKVLRDMEVKSNVDLSADQILALDALTGQLLDRGDVATAVRLGKLFSHQNQDVQLLLTCLRLAEGRVQPHQLSVEQRSFLLQRSASPLGSFRRRPLHSLRLSSMSSTTTHSPLGSLSADFVELPPREKQDALAALEVLAESLQHGRNVGARIVACYRAAISMDRPYTEVVTDEDTLGLLRLAIAQDCLHKFMVAGDLMSGAHLSKDSLALFLCKEVLAALKQGHTQGGVMWGHSLDTCFPLVLELCSDPALMAKHLLTEAEELRTTFADATEKSGPGVVVELLVRSHDAYTAACDMEGISHVLQKARLLTSELLQRKEWALMVRLVTGIGRYTDMEYVFQILKQHEQFEFLLGKGMDKIPGLKLALLEFVRRRCGEERELLRMVALHFRLHTEMAQVWETEARATVHSLLGVTRLEMRAGSKTEGSVKTPTKAPLVLELRSSPDTAHLLKLAMQSFSHAAEFYLKAEKLGQAMQCAHQAELLALQTSLGQHISTGLTVHCVLEQDHAQVSNLITNTLTFPQAWIVARAYSHPADWGAALYQQCILQGDSTYLEDLSGSVTLTPSLLEDVARRFQREKHVTPAMAAMMKEMVNRVKSVEAKYRLASQLGFKDVLEGMLQGPDLYLLKDTVWRRGYTHQCYS